MLAPREISMYFSTLRPSDKNITYCMRCGKLLSHINYEERQYSCGKYKKANFFFTRRNKLPAFKYQGFTLCESCYQDKVNGIRTNVDLEDLTPEKKLKIFNINN
jgi:hypothetical protein|tara:strand:- start:1891 stop:2202 length:312 start_codon:yes stop_codon:yes gene_type:complete